MSDSSHVSSDNRSADSPAIDTGDNAICEADDQRGVTRPDGGNQSPTAICDMGAFEVGPIDRDRIFANGFD